VPDHSTISRTRRLMDVETHQAVFQWVLQVLAEKKLLTARVRTSIFQKGAIWADSAALCRKGKI
jgi:hypothetical protein